jgi:hypothetical protein
MDRFDLKKLAAEVSAEHGIRIDPDDPMMAAITMNRLVFEQAVERAVKRLQASADEIDRAGARVQVRAGSALAQELKECSAALEKQMRSVIDDLAARTQTNRPPFGLTKARTVTIATLIAVLLLLLGATIGAQVAGRVRLGG